MTKEDYEEVRHYLLSLSLVECEKSKGFTPENAWGRGRYKKGDTYWVKCFDITENELVRVKAGDKDLEGKIRAVIQSLVKCWNDGIGDYRTITQRLTPSMVDFEGFQGDKAKLVFTANFRNGGDLKTVDF